jgi:hypothetical protein
MTSLTVSKKSWHFKAARWYRNPWSPVPDSLCPYFWAVVFGLALGLGIVAFCVMGAGATALLLVSMFAGLVAGIWPSVWFEGVYAYAILGWIATGGIAFALARTYYNDEEPDSTLFKPLGLPEKQANAVTNLSFFKVCRRYWAAVRDKVCPLLEFDE